VKKYVVELTEDGREQLHRLISAGSASARTLNRARILLKADVGKRSEGGSLLDREIAPMLETSRATVQRVRERFCRQGLLLRGLRRRASARTLPEDRVPLHASTRFVVEHGRDRDLRLGPPVSGQATRAGRADVAKGGASLV
jgi:hypothetical protein